MAFGPSGEPYVGFQDLGNGGKASVMTFNDTAWVNFGSAAFTPGTALFTDLVFSQAGKAYIAFEDMANSQKVTVMRYDTSWKIVGTAGFSAGEAWYESLAFNYRGIPYVAYRDFANSEKATVMKFSGTSWVNVGDSGFSAGAVDYTSLAFSPNGTTPYVGYKDEGNSDHASVMKFDTLNTTGINNITELRLSVYPDPATDKITVELSGLQNETSLSIVDIRGQQLMMRQITDLKTRVDISGLTDGVYFVRLTNNRSVEVKKFIKQTNRSN
jgi:hypothetical protein